MSDNWRGTAAVPALGSLAAPAAAREVPTDDLGPFLLHLAVQRGEFPLHMYGGTLGRMDDLLHFQPRIRLEFPQLHRGHHRVAVLLAESHDAAEHGHGAGHGDEQDRPHRQHRIQAVLLCEIGDNRWCGDAEYDDRDVEQTVEPLEPAGLPREFAALAADLLDRFRQDLQRPLIKFIVSSLKPDDSSMCASSN